MKSRKKTKEKNSFKRKEKCAQKEFDRADIVRDKWGTRKSGGHRSRNVHRA